MADQDPNSIVCGLMGMRDPDLLLNVGLGLMSAAKYGGNVGDGLSQALGNYQQQQLRKQQIRMGQMQTNIMQAQMPVIQAVANRYRQQPPPQGSAPQGPLLASNGPPQAAVGGPGLMGPQGGAPPTPSGGAPPSGGQPGGNPWDLMQLGADMDTVGLHGGGYTELGKAQLQYSPQIAQALKAAQDELAIAIHNRDQAAQGGDMNTAQMWDFKARKLSGVLQVSERNGNITAFTGGTGANGLPNFVGFNPDTGIQSTNQGASQIPGFAGAKGAIAGAEARGRATGEVEQVTRADGSKVFVNKASLLGGGGGGAPVLPRPGGPPAPGTAPAASAAPGGAVAALGPGTNEMLAGNAKAALEANKGYQDQAEAGQQMLTQTATLRGAAAQFPPGQFAGNRMKFLQYLSSAGLITPDQAKALGSAQEGTKIAIQLQAAATKQLGSREAAQIFQIMGKSLPNLELSQNGLDKVTGYMDGIARYNIARAEKAQGAAAGNDANAVNNVRNDFIKNSNPLYYIVASMPPAIQRETLQSMGDKRGAFLDSWKRAVQAGYAPRPSQYGLGSAQ